MKKAFVYTSSIKPNDEQKKAIDSQGNIIISAGAGSGKTRVLVERCMNLVFQRKTSMDRILMLTFTDAAAAEMKRRIQDELYRQIRDTQTVITKRQSNIQNASDEEIKKNREKLNFLNNEIGNLFGADICTIHSFCSKLVRQNRYKLNISEHNLFIINTVEEKRLAKKAFKKVLSNRYQKNSDQIVDFLSNIYNCGEGKLFELTWQFFTFLENMADPEKWIKKQRNLLEQPFPEHWYTKENISFFCLLQQKHRQKIPAAAQKSFEELEKNPNKEKLGNFFAKCTEKGNNPIKSDEKKYLEEHIVPLFQPESQCESVRSQCESVRSQWESVRIQWKSVRSNCLAMLDFIQEFISAFKSEKEHYGGFTFGDTLHAVLGLLKDTETGEVTPLAKYYQNQFDYIFVDEYQDTDGIQDEIIRCISRENTPNTLANRFLVGDVKQSIYRFRLADPSIFVGYEGLGKRKEGWEKISLQTNYRSRREILEFVNIVFTHLMHKEIGNIQFEEDSHLKAGRDDCNAPTTQFAPITFLAYAKEMEKNSNVNTEAENQPEDGSDEMSSDKLEFEARLIARELLKMHQSKELEWKDVGILCRSSILEKSSRLIKVFEEAGIPIEAPGKRLVDCAEIKPLINLLNIIDNPNQDILLMGVLNSVLANIRIKELMTIQKTFRKADKGQSKKSLWKIIQQKGIFEKDIEEKLQKFVLSINKWRSYLRIYNAPLLLREILLETNYEERLPGATRENILNIHSFLELANNFDPHKICALRNFLEFIKGIQNDPKNKDYTSFGTSTGENSVKLMTIHKSKGLEFPVVVLMSAGSKLSNSRENNYKFLMDKELGIQAETFFKEKEKEKEKENGFWFTSDNFGSTVLKNKQELEERGEWVRLLYVALTRTANRLLICGESSLPSLIKKIENEKQKNLPDSMQILIQKDNFMAWLENCILRNTGCEPQTLIPKLTSEGSESNPEGIPLSLKSITDSDYKVDCTYIFQKFPGKIKLEPEQSLLRKAPLPPILVPDDIEYPYEEVTQIPKRNNVTGLNKITVEFMQQNRAKKQDDAFWEITALNPQKWHDMREKQDRAIILGNAHHIFLEMFTIKPEYARELPDENSFKEFADLLLRKRYYTKKERNALNINWLRRFYQTRECKNFITRWDRCHREFRFNIRMNPSMLEKAGIHPTFHLDSEFIYVQGTIDLCMIDEKEIWVMDYKTNRGKKSEELLEKYRPQLNLYKVALETIYKHPVTHCYLALLETGDILEI